MLRKKHTAEEIIGKLREVERYSPILASIPAERAASADIALLLSRIAGINLVTAYLVTSQGRAGSVAII